MLSIIGGPFGQAPDRARNAKVHSIRIRTPCVALLSYLVRCPDEPGSSSVSVRPRISLRTMIEGCILGSGF
jgi:hypothetical protein